MDEESEGLISLSNFEYPTSMDYEDSGKVEPEWNEESKETEKLPDGNILVLDDTLPDSSVEEQFARSELLDQSNDEHTSDYREEILEKTSVELNGGDNLAAAAQRSDVDQLCESDGTLPEEHNCSDEEVPCQSNDEKTNYVETEEGGSNKDENEVCGESDIPKENKFEEEDNERDGAELELKVQNRDENETDELKIDCVEDKNLSEFQEVVGECGMEVLSQEKECSPPLVTRIGTEKCEVQNNDEFGTAHEAKIEIKDTAEAEKQIISSPKSELDSQLSDTEEKDLGGNENGSEGEEELNAVKSEWGEGIEGNEIALNQQIIDKSVNGSEINVLNSEESGANAGDELWPRGDITDELVLSGNDCSKNVKKVSAKEFFAKIKQKPKDTIENLHSSPLANDPKVVDEAGAVVDVNMEEITCQPARQATLHEPQGIFSQRAKLFHMLDGHWEENGCGNLILLKNEETDELRLLMVHGDDNFLNCTLKRDITFYPHDDFSWTWAEEGNIALMLRFEDKAMSAMFMAKVERARQAWDLKVGKSARFYGNALSTIKRMEEPGSGNGDGHHNYQSDTSDCDPSSVLSLNFNKPKQKRKKGKNKRGPMLGDHNIALSCGSKESVAGIGNRGDHGTSTSVWTKGCGAYGSLEGGDRDVFVENNQTPELPSHGNSSGFGMGSVTSRNGGQDYKSVMSGLTGGKLFDENNGACHEMPQKGNQRADTPSSQLGKKIEKKNMFSSFNEKMSKNKTERKNETCDSSGQNFSEPPTNTNDKGKKNNFFKTHRVIPGIEKGFNNINQAQREFEHVPNNHEGNGRKQFSHFAKMELNGSSIEKDCKAPNISYVTINHADEPGRDTDMSGKDEDIRTPTPEAAAKYGAIPKRRDSSNYSSKHIPQTRERPLERKDSISDLPLTKILFAEEAAEVKKVKSGFSKFNMKLKQKKGVQPDPVQQAPPLEADSTDEIDLYLKRLKSKEANEKAAAKEKLEKEAAEKEKRKKEAAIKEKRKEDIAEKENSKKHFSGPKLPGQSTSMPITGASAIPVQSSLPLESLVIERIDDSCFSLEVTCSSAKIPPGKYFVAPFTGLNDYMKWKEYGKNITDDVDQSSASHNESQHIPTIVNGSSTPACSFLELISFFPFLVLQYLHQKFTFSSNGESPKNSSQTDSIGSKSENGSVEEVQSYPVLEWEPAIVPDLLEDSRRTPEIPRIHQRETHESDQRYEIGPGVPCFHNAGGSIKQNLTCQDSHPNFYSESMEEVEAQVKESFLADSEVSQFNVPPIRGSIQVPSGSQKQRESGGMGIHPDFYLQSYPLSEAIDEMNANIDKLIFGQPTESNASFEEGNLNSKLSLPTEFKVSFGEDNAGIQSCSQFQQLDDEKLRTDKLFYSEKVATSDPKVNFCHSQKTNEKLNEETNNNEQLNLDIADIMAKVLAPVNTNQQRLFSGDAQSTDFTFTPQNISARGEKVSREEVDSLIDFADVGQPNEIQLVPAQEKKEFPLEADKNDEIDLYVKRAKSREADKKAVAAENLEKEIVEKKLNTEMGKPCGTETADTKDLDELELLEVSNFVGLLADAVGVSEKKTQVLLSNNLDASGRETGGEPKIIVAHDDKRSDKAALDINNSFPSVSNEQQKLGFYSKGKKEIGGKVEMFQSPNKTGTEPPPLVILDTDSFNATTATPVINEQRFGSELIFQDFAYSRQDISKESCIDSKTDSHCNNLMKSKTEKSPRFHNAVQFSSLGEVEARGPSSSSCETGTFVPSFGGAEKLPNIKYKWGKK